MYPRNTIYRLARTPRDYRACRKLFEENHGAEPLHNLSYPTVVAVRDGEIIGFLSTDTRKKVIMAGPLEVKGGKNMITFIRLIEAYEVVLRVSGVTSFMFYLRADREDSFNHKRVEEYKDFGVKFLRFDHGQALFWKDVKDGRR